MTTTESIFAAWLFLLTLAAIGLFAGWLGNRAKIGDIIVDLVQLRFRDERPPAKVKPKRQRRTSKADLPIALVPTPPGERIDLSTPLAERVGGAQAHSNEPTTLTVAELTVEQKYDLTTGKRLVGGVGGTKDGDGGGEAA